MMMTIVKKNNSISNENKLKKQYFRLNGDDKIARKCIGIYRQQNQQKALQKLALYGMRQYTIRLSMQIRYTQLTTGNTSS
jgi:hypothetical protein